MHKPSVFSSALAFKAAILFQVSENDVFTASNTMNIKISKCIVLELIGLPYWKYGRA